MRVDCHIHLIPPAYRAGLERRSLLPYPLPPWSQEALDGFLDAYAIDAAVMSLSPPGVWFGDLGFTRELARLVNEETAALVHSAPRRYAGLAVLPLPDIDAALAELAYALDVLELDGIALLSNLEGTYLGTPQWRPVWEELDRRGAYVFIHPNAPHGGVAIPQHPVWLYEFPFDTTRAIVDLLFSGTLEQCPNVRVQVSHLGGTAPFLVHRIASLAAREPSAALAAPSGALATLARLYYDTGLSNHVTAIEATRAVVPADHIVFGTDWPYLALPAGGDPAPELSALGTSERRALEHDNIRALVPRLGG